jgi:hypothetical protein
MDRHAGLHSTAGKQEVQAGDTDATVCTMTCCNIPANGENLASASEVAPRGKREIRALRMGNGSWRLIVDRERQKA